MAGGSTLMDPWQAAYAAYIKDLNAEEQALFATATLDNLLASTDTAQKQHKEESRSRYIFDKLQPLVDAIDQYGRALDAYASTYSLAMGPIWGSIRVLLHIAKAFGKYFEKIIDMLARIGDILPRCQVYQTLFPTNERLLQAISIAYLDIIDFCWRAKNIFRKMKKSTSVHLTLKLLWRDFNKDFEEKLNNFRTHVKIVEKQAGISHMIEASEERALIRFKQKVDRRNWLLSQLSSISCVNKHLKEHEKLHKGTGSWLTKTVEFVDWVTGTRSDCLWCYGIPGSGKTVLMSYVVDELSKDAVRKGFTIEPLSSQDIIKRGINGHKTIVVYYYCDSSDSRSLKLENILGTIIRQMLEIIVISEVLEQQIEKHFRPPARVATGEELFSLLLEVVKSFSNIYILIDGLDECNNEDINKILPMLNQLLRSTRPLLKVALFSREETNIAKALKDYPRVRVSSDKISLDLSIFIRETVETKINRGKLCISEPLLKMEVINTLTNGAQGMFLWVHFQLLDLCDACSETEVRKTLQSLPQGMTATYKKILEKIASNRTNVVLAQKMFKWIICAKRPMLLAELTEAVAFKATDKSWSKEKVLDAVRLYQAGGNLVIIDEKDDTVRLAHHTVQQFLLDLPDHESATTIIPFHFRLPEADLEAGEICVAYLSFSDFERQISTLRPHDVMPVITLPLPTAILERTTSKLGLNFGVSRLFNFAHYLCTGQFSQETGKSINIDFSKFARLKVQPTQNLQEKYLFLNYAIENWISHTTNLSENNADTWRLFKRLAINKPLPFDVRPWGDVNDSNATTYTTLLRWACNAEHIPLMKLLPQNYFTEDQSLPRMVRKGTVEFLLERGFDIETKDDLDGQTALIRAAMEGNAALVNLLLANGANIDARDDHERTALVLAVEKGHTSVTELLLIKGAGIVAFHGVREKALCLAAEKGHKTIIELLLAKDANYKVNDDLGRLALSLAAEKGHASVIDLLLDNGVSINANDRSNRTALTLAAEEGHASVIEVLLAKGAKIDANDRSERTALSLAAEKGHTRVIELLLAKGANIERKDRWSGRTALIRATIENHTVAVKILLENGANVEAEDKIGQTALHEAAGRGHTDLVTLLVEKARLERRDGNGLTALCRAAREGYEDVVELLLNRGANIEAEDYFRPTALDWAVENKHAAVVRLLVTKEADIKAKNGNGQHTLYQAAAINYVDVVEVLLTKKIEIEAIDYRHRTALMCAAAFGHAAVIGLLLTIGVDIDATDSLHRTALTHAAKSGHTAAVEKLLMEGADVKARDYDGLTALTYAAQFGHEIVVTLLLTKGADIEAKNRDGRTALTYAAQFGHEIVVTILLTHGADIEAKDYDGRTALHWAVIHEHAAVVEMLLAKGANVNWPSNNVDGCRLPLQDAAMKGNVAIVKLLLAHGAKFDKAALEYAIAKQHTAVIELLLAEREKSRE